MLIEKLMIGTVQLGLEYGINNNSGMPNLADSFEILRHAESRHIKALDTAISYGKSHEVIGKYCQSADNFRVYSKFSLANGEANASLKRATQELKMAQIECFSFHSFADYADSPKNTASTLKESGLTKKVGVSVYTDEELAEVVDATALDVIQVPFNLLDCSMKKRNLLAEAKDNGKTIHVRSVFLQGLFFQNLADMPAYLTPLSQSLKRVNEIAKEMGLSIHQLCLLFPLRMKNIDAVIVGVETLEQLKKNIEIVDSLEPIDEIFEDIYNIEIENPRLLNPVNWVALQAATP